VLAGPAADGRGPAQPHLEAAVWETIGTAGGAGDSRAWVGQDPRPLPPSRTNWTRLVPPPVLIGHVSSGGVGQDGLVDLILGIYEYEPGVKDTTKQVLLAGERMGILDPNADKVPIERICRYFLQETSSPTPPLSCGSAL